MLFGQHSPLFPRNGRVLVVGIIARISGCQGQTEISLDDQIDHCKEYVEMLYKGEVEYIVISTKGKGEQLDRPELQELEKLLRSRKLDLLLVEELGRIVRGGEAARLCGVAVDHATRVLAPNDGVDTNDPTWESAAMKAASSHVEHNILTSLRIKHKMMNRFTRSGFTAKRDIYGYIVPEGARSYADWQKDDNATPNIREGSEQLMVCLNGETVAASLNAQGVPTGPYSREKKWDGVMVLRYYRNLLLSGRPQRGAMHSIKNYETGRRRSVKNPKGPQYVNYPHLAHLDPAFQDELIAQLAEKNVKFKRDHEKGCDCRLGIPRSRTRFPGQHVRCWYCGRRCVWGGNGVTERLMCSGAREWKCWNSIGFNGALCAKRISEVILAELARLEGIDAQYRELVERALRGDVDGLAVRWDAIHREESAIEKERQNVELSIRELGPRPMLGQILDGLEARATKAAQERWKLEQLGSRKPTLPASIAELRSMISEEFQRLAIESPEFGYYLRALVPEFHVYLVRLCDGGILLPRIRVKLELAGNIADSVQVPELKELLSRVVTIDLFDPVQREAIREESVRLAAQGLTHRQIAAKVPGNPTSTAVTNAINLDKRMRSLGLTTPYQTVLTPPDDLRLCRHKNSRYRFEPLDGYQPPAV